MESLPRNGIMRLWVEFNVVKQWNPSQLCGDGLGVYRWIVPMATFMWYEVVEGTEVEVERAQPFFNLGYPYPYHILRVGMNADILWPAIKKWHELRSLSNLPCAVSIWKIGLESTPAVNKFSRASNFKSLEQSRRYQSLKPEQLRSSGVLFWQLDFERRREACATSYEPIFPLLKK